MTLEPSISKDKVQNLLAIRDFKQLRVLLKEQETADLAELYTSISIPECILLFRITARNRRVDLFSHLDVERQEELVIELPDVIVSNLLNEMEADVRTRLLENLEVEIRQSILLKMSPEERQVAWKLLSYPEGSVGRLMTPDFISLKPEMSVKRSLEFIHWSKNIPSDYLHYLFVTDEKGCLIGEISLAVLVVCDPPSCLIKDIMNKNHVSLQPTQEENDAVEIFRKYDRNYIPVVDVKKKLLGMVTADDVFDIAEEEATEDIQQFGGQTALEVSYFQTSFFSMIKKRVLLLALLFLSGFFTLEAIKSYENLLQEWSFLMFFIPTILSVGGNSGTQAASLIIRGIAINEINLFDAKKVLKRELALGLVLGAFLSILGFFSVITRGLGSTVALIVSLSVILVVTLGVITGSMLPFLVKKMKLDPAIISSPAISTLLDVTGLLVYFHVAMFIMRMASV